jgi:hypothetical protein
MGPPTEDSHDPVADAPVQHIATYFNDCARTLVARDVRYAGEWAKLTVDKVTALNRDCFHSYQDFIRPAARVNDIFIMENLGPAVLIVDSGFHRLLSPRDTLDLLRRLQHNRCNTPAFGRSDSNFIHEVRCDLGRRVGMTERNLRASVCLRNVKGKRNDPDAFDLRLELPNALERFLEVVDERGFPQKLVGASHECDGVGLIGRG